MHNRKSLPYAPNVRQENDNRRDHDFQASTSRCMTSSLPLKPWSSLFKIETCHDTREMTEKDKTESFNENLTNLNTSIADHIGSATSFDPVVQQKSWSVLFTKGTDPDAREMTAEDNSVLSDASMSNIETLDANKVSIATAVGTAFLERPWNVWCEKNSSDAIDMIVDGSNGESTEVDSYERVNLEMECLDLCSGRQGGFDGSSWLLGLDSYSPSQDLMETLISSSASHKYVSVGRLNGNSTCFVVRILVPVV